MLKLVGIALWIGTAGVWLFLISSMILMYGYDLPPSVWLGRLVP